MHFFCKKICSYQKKINYGFEAIRNNNVDQLENLLSQGLNPNARRSRVGYTLLIQAVTSLSIRNPRGRGVLDRRNIVQSLFAGRYKADPDLVSYTNGRIISVLHIAVTRNFPQLVNLLLTNGAKMIRDHKGKTPLDYLKKSGFDSPEWQEIKIAFESMEIYEYNPKSNKLVPEESWEKYQDLQYIFGLHDPMPTF